MTIEEYREKNNILQKKIISEIEKVKSGQSRKNVPQLQGILKELKESSIKRKLPLYYPHIIVDSWNYWDPLGIELMELAELYEKIN